MKVISTTLAGPETGDLLTRALDSVESIASLHLVVCAGISRLDFDAFRASWNSFHDPARLAWVDFAWCSDFAAARNFALDEATKLGGDWSINVDTDEQLHWDGASRVEVLADELATTSADVLLVSQADGSYAKERCFRLPVKQRWVGRTHEYFPAQAPRALLDGVTFSELPKSPEQLAQKFSRDLGLLVQQSSDEPDSSRWHYYRGDALHGLGLRDEAVEAFLQCSSLSGWSEERAWACFRAASILLGQHQYQRAISICCAGLAIHAGIAELAWVAALAHYRLGNMEQAIHWATMSVTRGEFSEHPRVERRIGFRDPAGLYEGPLDVLRHAYAALDMPSAAALAEIKFEAAKQQRASSRAKPRSNWDRPGL